MMLDAFSPSAPLMDPSAVPREIRLRPARDALVLVMEDREQLVLPAQALRAACRCAWCTRDRAQGRFSAEFTGIALLNVTGVGDFAVNLAFSDGHARGVYPFTYLRALAGAREPQSPQSPFSEVLAEVLP